MKIDFGTQFYTFDGTPIVDENRKSVSLGTVSVNALLSGDAPSGEKKLARYLLAQRIHAGDVLDVTVEEVAELKELVGKAYAPIISGQAWQLLEGSGTTLPDVSGSAARTNGAMNIAANN